MRSRIDGSFEIQIPEGTHAVKAVVSPPAGSLKAYEVNVSKEAEILLQVDSQGGELVIEVGKEDSFEGRILAVWQGDVGLPLGTLIRWAEGHGARFYDRGQVRVPKLAPGYYTVCLGTPAVIDPDDIEEWQKSRAACAPCVPPPTASTKPRICRPDELALRLEGPGQVGRRGGREQGDRGNDGGQEPPVETLGKHDQAPFVDGLCRDATGLALSFMRPSSSSSRNWTLWAPLCRRMDATCRSR